MEKDYILLMLSEITKSQKMFVMVGVMSAMLLAAMFLMLLAFTASFFLKEIPLRKSHVKRSALEEAAVEIAVEEGEFRPKGQPKI